MISSTGTGAGASTITLTGSSTATTANEYGILIQDAGAMITSVDGDILLTGDSDALDGIRFTAGGVIASTGTGANAASITLDGTATSTTADADGLQLSGAGTQITSVDGDIQITGTTGNGDGILLDASTALAIQATGTADIVIDGATTGGGSGISIQTAIESNSGSVTVISLSLIHI